MNNLSSFYNKSNGGSNFIVRNLLFNFLFLNSFAFERAVCNLQLVA